MDAMSDTAEAARRTEMKYMLKIPKGRHDGASGGGGVGGGRQQVEEL